MESQLSVDVPNSSRRCSYDRRPSSGLVIGDTYGNGAFVSGAQLLDQKTEKTNDQPAVTDWPVRHSISTAEQRTLDIVYHFLVTTTAHGWARVARGYNAPIKAFWLCVTLLAFIVNVTHVVVLVTQYLKYPFEQVTEMEVSFVEFPSITICNLQPMSRSTALAMNADPTTKLHQWNNATRDYFDYLQANNDSTSYEYEMMYDRMRGPRGFFENIGIVEASVVGHQAHDFIVHCTFSKALCSADNFSWFASADFYNCYTFNGVDHTAAGDLNTSDSSGSSSRPSALIASSTGPESGLSLTFYVENDDGSESEHDGSYYSFQNTGNAVGVRVTVHAPHTRPNPVDSGFDVPPGYSSSIGLSVTQYRRLGLPYGQCVNKQQQAGYSDRFVYSTNGCLMKCQQMYVISQCRCASASLPPLNVAEVKAASSIFVEEFQKLPHTVSADGWTPATMAQVHFCGNFNPTRPAGQMFIDTQCESEAMRLFSVASSIRSKCTCEAPCLETSYRRDSSYSYWPADHTQGTFFRKYILENSKRESLKAYKNLYRYNVSELVRRDLIRKNFVRLNVYIESLVVDQIVQKASYSLFNLFSDIGGTFGLWIGMSVLTWGEVVEFGVHLGIRWIKKLRHQRLTANNKAIPPSTATASAAATDTAACEYGLDSNQCTSKDIRIDM